MDQGCTLEIVAKPAHIHPNPKTSFTVDIRATIAGAAPADLGVSPKVASSVEPCPKKAAISAPKLRGVQSLDQHQHPSESFAPRHNSVQATIGPERLVVARSDNQVLNETKCDTKSKQISSITVDNEVEQMPVESTSVPVHEKPTLHENFMHFSPKSKLKTIKQFLDTFEYKQTPGTHFNTHKMRPLARIMDIARMIIYSPQPIKCVEAVFLALYLTASIAECDRIPLSFKTSCHGQVYQHIVLLVRYGNRFGAFGISRHPDLMTKDIKFSCIREVVEDYKKTYEEADHLVLKIRVGLQVEHEVNSPNFVCWRHLSLNPTVQPWEKCCEALESHLMKQRKLWNKWLLLGKGSDPRRKCIERKAPLDNKLVRNIVELNRKVKLKVHKSSTIVKPDSLKNEEVEERIHDKREPLPENMMVMAKTRKENIHNSRSFHAKSKPLVKVHIFKSQASRFLRQSVQFINPKFFFVKNVKSGSPFESRKIEKAFLSVHHAQQSTKSPQEK